MSTVGKSTQLYSQFDPRSIGSCALWLDGADASTLTLSGNNVTQWRDKSGNSNHATAAGTASPTFQSNIANARSGVQGASNTYMSNTTMVIPLSNRTVFLVCSTYSTTSPTLGIAQLGTVPTGVAHGVDGLNTTVYQNQPNNQFGWIYRYFSGGGYYRQWSCNGFGSAATTPLRIYGETVSNLVHSPFVDGSNAGDSTITAAPTDCSGYYLGARYDTNAVQFGYPATFAEFIVYSNALPESQRQQVEGYLAGKWGIRRATQTNISVGVFNPTSITGLTTWLDATDASSLTIVGGKISQWQDKSGLSNHFSVVGTSSNGVVQSNYQNGLNVVNFTGSNLYRAPSGSGVYPLDAYIVVALKSVARTDLLGMGPTGTDNFNGLEMGEYTANRWHNGSSYSTRTPNTVSPTNEFSTSFLLMNWSLADSNFVIRRNGVTLTSTNSYTYTPGTGSVLQIGDRYTPRTSPDTQLNAYVAELLVFNNQLGTTQRQQVEAYLTNRWNLAPSIPLSLVATHPYKALTTILRPFTPLDLSGCVMWLDAADETQIVYSSGSNVSQLKDKGSLASVSNVYNCTATRRAQGTLGKSLPTLSNATGATTQVHGITGNAAMTYVMVGRVNSSSNNIYVRGDLTSGGGDGYSGSLNFGILSNANTPYLGITGVSGLVTGTASTSGPHAVIGIWNGTNATLYDNGTLSGTSGTTTLNQTSATTNLDFGNNELGEFMIFNRALSGSERQLLEMYLANKWGLVALTPANHSARFSPALSPQFRPNLLSNCALWLDGADRTTLTLSGSNVTQWNDKSGNGTNAGAYNTTPFPTYSSSNTSVQFSGAQGLTTSLSASTNIQSGFVVALFTAVANTNTLLGSANGDGGRQFRVSGSVLQTISQSVAGVVTSGATLSNSIVYICEYVNDGTTLTHYLTGSTYASGSARTYGTTLTTSIGLRFGGAEGFAGNIYEICVYNSALSTSARQQVEGYLATKWGLQTSLPSNHPYRNSKAL